jgi:uncharacterized protein YodC (DUF2158 family)
MSQKLIAGETVRLKSGGPLMTIAWIDEESSAARCEWFDSKKEFRSSDFLLTSLIQDDDSINVSFI